MKFCFLFCGIIKEINGGYTPMIKQKQSIFFRVLFFFVRIFYGKVKVDIKEPLEKGSIFVANHAQINGPIVSYLYHPNPKKIWVISDMCHIKTVPSYAMEDFWGHKKKPFRFFYRILSFVIAPLSVHIMKNGGTIPVYKSMAISKTFQKTMQSLFNEEDVIIYAENRNPFNHIINAFSENFVDVAKIYYKRYQKRLHFYPVYICPKLRRMVIGEKVTFDETKDIVVERSNIIRHLQSQITSMALELPRHKVIPYDANDTSKYNK